MSRQASYPASDDLSRHRGTESVASPVSEPGGATIGSLQDRLARIADALGATTRNNGSSGDIDRLLHAIAARDHSFRKSTAEQAGTIAVTLDSIMRWIGKAEDRFSTLAKTSIENHRQLSRIAELAETREQALRSQMDKTCRIVSGTIGGITDIAQEVIGLQAISRKQSAALKARIEQTGKTISILEEKLTHLENRLTGYRPDRLAKHISGLAEHLDTHSRLATRNAASSVRHFELMTDQIEAFGEEIRKLRTENHTKQALPDQLPELLEKLELLTQDSSPQPEQRNNPADRLGTATGQPLEALSDKLQQVLKQFDTERADARSAREATRTDMDALRHRIQQLEQLGRTFRTGGRTENPPSDGATDIPPTDAHRTGGDNTGIRTSFIAAARQATRSGYPPRETGGAQDARESGGPTGRFLRTDGSGGT